MLPGEENGGSVKLRLLYSLPQMVLTWAMPHLTASTGNDGLSSKTLMWPGFTNGLSAAKLTVPEPGAA